MLLSRTVGYASFLSFLVIAVGGCSKPEPSNNTGAETTQKAPAVTASESGGKVFTCEAASEELVSSVLGIAGLKLTVPKTTKYRGFASCQYKNEAVNAFVVVYFKEGSPGMFASERKQVETISKDVAAVPGLGDEAYHGTSGSKTIVVQTVGARKGDVFVSVNTAAADFPKVKALVAKLLDAR